MIQLEQKQDCCGCGACVQRCPKQCITMQEDEEGFLYPHVDLNGCTQCGLCERVCPILNQGEQGMPITVYAAKNRNEEVRMKSSSGGIFTPLAEFVLAQHGVVFGAKFDANWTVIHGYTETIDGLAAFRGSKYVQSQINNCYRQAEEFLKVGRQVLFSGTPCQIAGLHSYLMHNYDNLLTVDVVCHGVPSPIIWRDYLKFILCPQCNEKTPTLALSEPTILTDISFRDKSTGWKRYSFLARKSALKFDSNIVFLHETVDKNLYMNGFLKDLYLRPSCHACPARKGKSGSDITIADYWGISADIDDDKGVGLVLIHSSKGGNVYSTLNIDSVETTYAQALAGNPCMERSVAISKYRTLFWQEYKLIGINAITTVCRKMQPPLAHRIMSLSKGIVKRIIGRR